ncbi:MAG TPA: 23S rRNA (guanosine(2251)-2'-O)-methyltransferase RlmB [Mycobacteriales bacterium]|nr:23S rRNA (guanosine(2251)-2'-O)-methyltransferase RlmB [Mycobacteriales bacterium]
MAPGRAVGGGAGKAGRAGKAGKAGPKPSIGGGGHGGRAGKAGSSRKGAPVGSGGQGKDRLKGKGPTPPGEERKGHPKARRAAAATKRGVPEAAPGARPRPATGRRTPVGIPSRRPSSGAAERAPRRPHPRSKRPGEELEEVVVGRNPVVEALRAGVQGRALLVGRGVDLDPRVTEALALAAELGIPTREAVKAELDNLSDGSVHQGLALQVPSYEYAHPEDLLRRAFERPEPALLIALDGVTDPRNLGAILRSAAAFGAHGVLLPERRAAGVSVTAWRTSAGAAAHLPVARAVNLARALRSYSDAGLTLVGLDAGGEVSLDNLEVADDPLCLVIGAEGAGLGRLVGEQCDLVVSIPMAGPTESLNASVAASVVLAEVARRRRTTVR